jgi:periplasmic protein TonB
VSLVLHAFLLSLIVLLTTPKVPPVFDVIRVHFVEASSLSTAMRAVPPHAAAPTPRKTAEKTEIVVPQLQKRNEAPDVTTVEKTVPINDTQKQLFSGNSMVTAAKHIGWGDVAGTAPAARPAVIETAFGTAGAPAFVHREQPVYPMLARRLGKEGKVVLKLLIDSRGNVQAVEIVEDEGYGFAEAAVEAVRKSTFAPALRNGERVTARAILPVRFRLQ